MFFTKIKMISLSGAFSLICSLSWSAPVQIELKPGEYDSWSCTVQVTRVEKVIAGYPGMELKDYGSGYQIKMTNKRRRGEPRALYILPSQVNPEDRDSHFDVFEQVNSNSHIYGIWSTGSGVKAYAKPGNSFGRRMIGTSSKSPLTIQTRLDGSLSQLSVSGGTAGSGGFTSRPFKFSCTGLRLK